MKKWSAALVLTVAMAMSAGCARNVNAPAPTPIQTAATYLDNFAASAQGGQTTEIAIYQQGLIDKTLHVQIQRSFEKVADYQAAVSRLMTAGASQASVNAAVVALTNEINGDLANGVLGVKDPASQAKLKALVTALGSAAQEISIAYGGGS